MYEREPDPNDALGWDDNEPEPLPTADALAALCELFQDGKDGYDLGFSESDRPGGFGFQPWEPDIAINFMGSEFILSLRPSNRIV